MMRPTTAIASHMCSELGPFSATKVSQIIRTFTALPNALTPDELTDPPLTGPDQRPDSQDMAELPHLPATGFAHFRAEAFRLHTTAAFAQVDAVYRHGLKAACDSLRHLVPEQTTPWNERVQLFLTGLVHDSPSRAHTLA